MTGWLPVPEARRDEAWAENADLRSKLEAASAAEGRMNDAFAGCRERLSQEIRHREAAEGRIERAREALEQGFLWHTLEQRAEGFRERLLAALASLSEPANAEGIASEGGSDSLWGQGCPEPVWDGPYRMRCGLGGDRGTCSRHGKFADAPSAEAGQ
jgi:hypothetical protein